MSAAFQPFFGETLPASKKNLFALTGYKIYGTPVRDFHLSQARHVIVSAPARTSKSYAAAPEAIHDFFPRIRFETDADGKKKIVAERSETIIWMVAVDYSMAKEWDYAWQQLIDKKLIEKLGGKVEASYNSPNQGNLLIRVLWPFCDEAGTPARSILQVKSASNEKSLQGEQVFLAIVSEAAEHSDDLLPKYLETRCTRIIYPTTPKRKAKWLYDLMQKGKQSAALSVDSFTFTKECNPKYDWAGYAIAKEKSRLTWGAPENDPGFLEQFEGEWTFEGGKVLPFRWIEDGRGEINIVKRLQAWVYGATWYAALDYGFNDPTFVGFFAFDPGSDEFVIASEIYQTGLVPSDVVEWARKRERDLGIQVHQWIPDPQEPMLTQVMRNAGLPLFHTFSPGYLRDRAAGYSELRDALSINPLTGRPRFTVHASCENTIREMTDIRFKDAAKNEFKEGALVGADHAIDGCRALCRSGVKALANQSDWMRDFQRQRKANASYAVQMRSNNSSLVGRSPFLMERSA